MKVRYFLLSLLIVFILTGCSKGEDNEKVINKYDANLVCKKHMEEIHDGEINSSESVIYIYYDESKFVNKAIYQSITNLDDASSYDIQAYDDIKEMYDSIDGCEAHYYKTKNELVLEIKYNYEKLDLNSFKEKLGNILDDTSLFAKVKAIPVKLEVFKNIEVNDYECE